MTFETTTDRVRKLAEKSSPLGATILFTFSDDPGAILLDGKGDANTVDSTGGESECTITTSLADLNGLISGDINPMMAFMGGKIKVDGDLSVAMKLGQLFS